MPGRGGKEFSRPVGLRRTTAAVAGLLLLATLCAFLLLAETASAQPVAEWRAVLGGSSDEFAHAVVLSGDGGYVIAGETGSFGAGAKDGWVVKLNAAGEQVWASAFGGANDDIFYDVQKTGDGGYILAGETRSHEEAPAESNFWLVKTNPDGETEWERNFGSSERPEPSATVATSDAAQAVSELRGGGYVIAGSSTGSSGTSVWLVRTTASGRILWGRNPGLTTSAVAHDVAQTHDGGFVIAGSTGSATSGSEAMLIKTDAAGNTSWTSTFGDQFNDEARSLVVTGDGGYVLGGFSWSYGSGQSDFWLIKANRDGLRQWQRSYGGLARESAHALIQTSDGGYALAGWSESFSSRDRFWVIKTSSTGNLQWSRAYPQSPLSPESIAASSGAGARAIRQTEDLGFIVAGWTGPVAGARDILVIKTAPIEAWPAAESGPVAMLENTGEAAITFAAVGFTAEDGGNSTGPVRFWSNGKIVSRDNPLPPGAVACSQPKAALAGDSRLSFDQIGVLDSVYLDTLSKGEEPTILRADGEAVTFDPTSGGQAATGSLSLAAQSPCEQAERQLPEGPPSPEGLSASVSEANQRAIELEWDVSKEPEVTGYAVYFSKGSSGPFRQISWMTPEAEFSDFRPGDGSTFRYGVSAVNLWGLESPISPVTGVTSVDVSPPQPPSGLRLVSADRDTGRALLEWNVVTDDSIRGYRLYRQDGDGPRTPVSALLFGTSFQDWTLPGDGDFVYTVTAVDRAGNESGPSNIAPASLDFFGTVTEARPNFAGGGRLLVATGPGVAEVDISRETRFDVGNLETASLSDLDVGDAVAVTLEENGATAKQVHLVPSTTRNRHFTGTVLEVSAERAVIQPALEDSEVLTVTLGGSVKVTPHRGTTGLTAGAFVIVSYTLALDDSTIKVIEINTVPPPRTDGPNQETGTEEEDANIAVLRGVFEGINRQNANILLSSVELSLDVRTVMETGLTVGEAVFAEAELLADGTLLARRVGRDEGAGEPEARTTLRGVFQEHRVEDGRWLVSGIELATDRRTSAESLPKEGQRVLVSAILREEGTLYARDIQAQAAAEEPAGEHTVHIDGIFQEIKSSGEWVIGGAPITVGSNTILTGRPSLGRRVSATAIYTSQGLEGVSVSSAPSEYDQPVRTVSIRGEVGSITGDSVVVDGIRVSLSNLTKTLGEIEPGDKVRIKAEIEAGGGLTAREVSEAGPEGETGETRGSPANIEGRIERLLDNGGLLVNGIPVQVSTLTEIKAALQVGASVQVRGLLQRGGSVLARDILGYGPDVTGGTEARIQGVVSDVTSGAGGRASSFVVDGITVFVDRLSRLEVDPANGVAVGVHAIVVNGEILAVSVEPQPLGNVGALPIVQMQGEVRDMPTGPVPLPLDITINGVPVRISSETRIVGSLTGGSVAEVSGRISDGVLHAREIERVVAFDQKQEEFQARFSIRGPLQDASLDSDGRPDRLLVSGERIIVESLSEFIDEVFVGDSVTVEGVIRDGILVATVIRLNERGERGES